MNNSFFIHLDQNKELISSSNHVVDLIFLEGISLEDMLSSKNIETDTNSFQYEVSYYKDNIYIHGHYQSVKEKLHEERIRLLGEISSNIAHDINNPLSGIISSSELSHLELDDLIECTLESQEDNSELNEICKSIKSNLEGINKSAARVSLIVEGIKTLSNGGRSDYRKEDLSLTIRSSIAISSATLKENSVDITFDTEHFENNPVFMNKIMISQAIVNLIKNSCDAIRERPTYDRWIEIKILEDEEFIDIHFMDSGDGIKKDIKDKIFERYFTTKDIDNGTGLGLHMCRKIFHQHQGDIVIDESSRNTKFVLSIAKSLS